MSETRDVRLDRLEKDVREIKAILARLEPLIVRIDERLNSPLPHLATKAVRDEEEEMRRELNELLSGLEQ
jgi:hypothetical protein